MRLKTLASLALAFCASSAYAANPYVAVRLAPSSFNQDGIVDYGAPTPLGAVTATMDGGTAKTGNTWYEVGYNAAAPTTGVPTGFFFGQTDPTSSFYIENARTDQTLKNVLLLDGTATSGTLSFITPRAATSLAFITSSGNGAGTLHATVHFSNGAPDATGLTFSSPDWFGNADPRVVTSKGRVDVVSGALNNVGSDNPRLYEEIVNLPAGNASNPVSSIDLTWTGAGTGTHTMILGVSTAVPEPASLGVMGLGALSLLARRRRA